MFIRRNRPGQRVSSRDDPKTDPLAVLHLAPDRLAQRPGAGLHIPLPGPAGDRLIPISEMIEPQRPQPPLAEPCHERPEPRRLGIQGIEADH